MGVTMTASGSGLLPDRYRWALAILLVGALLVVAFLPLEVCSLCDGGRITVYVQWWPDPIGPGLSGSKGCPWCKGRRKLSLLEDAVIRFRESGIPLHR